MNDAPKRHEPCPWCGEDDPAQFSVMGWPHPRSPDWLAVVCSSCQAQGPAVPRVKGESLREWVNWAWELWDARDENGPDAPDAAGVDPPEKALIDAFSDHTVGDKVTKTGGDYTLDGVVVARFEKRSGAVRYVVEDDRGILMIYSTANLKPRTPRRTGPSTVDAGNMNDERTP